MLVERIARTLYKESTLNFQSQMARLIILQLVVRIKTIMKQTLQGKDENCLKEETGPESVPRSL